MSHLKAKPPIGGQPIDGNGNGTEANEISTADYSRPIAPLSTPALLRFADLHEDLAFFYLDKAEAAVDAPVLEFNYWYGRCVNGLTWCEILRNGRTGNDIIPR